MQTEGKLFQNISATTAAFTLIGGYYNVAVQATWGGGTVKLQMLLPNGSYGDVGSSTTFTADGQATVQLPPGQYVINVATATAVYAGVARIPVA